MFLDSFSLHRIIWFSIDWKMDIVLSIVWLVLCIVAIIGSILPWIPWPQLWYVAILIVQFFMDRPFSWWFIIIWWVLMVLLMVADYYLPLLWTKKFWWSKRWNRWCIFWMLVWMFFWPVGLIIWPFGGALIWEFLRQYDIQKSIKPAFWAFIWFLWGIFLKLVASIILMVYFCIGCYTHFFLTLDSFSIGTNALSSLL